MAGAPDRIAIIGAGQAGGQAAYSLRLAGYEGAITLIGDEPAPPYQRPPLSKAYLKGELEAERLAAEAQSRTSHVESVRRERDEQMRLADLKDPDVRTDDEGYRIDEHGNRVNVDDRAAGDRHAGDSDVHDERPLGRTADDHNVDAADRDTEGHRRDRVDLDDDGRPDVEEGGTSRPRQHNV